MADRKNCPNPVNAVDYGDLQSQMKILTFKIFLAILINFNV